MTEESIGAELIRRGWNQGSLFRASSVPMPYLGQAGERGSRKRMGEPSTAEVAVGWKLQQATLAEDDYLAVVSQVCDLARAPTDEPYVETVRAFWTSDKSVIHQARTNSLRRFLLRERITADGVEALIADATTRVLIEKASLLAVEPEWAFDEGDTTRPREFRKWLGERYSREALPDDLVLAVQRPIVRAVVKLRESDERLRTLWAFREILFVVQDEGPPLQVELWLLLNEGDEVPRPSDEDTATLAGWLADVLAHGGKAALAHWEVFDATRISVHDYLNAYGLPLDDYTLTEELGRLP